ncbi:MAG: ATP-binding cassette domain-containing protein [Chloroflexota bacterium]
MPQKDIVLEAKGITKQFPGVLANDKVDFDLRHGEVHALLGENGAGKTTLMNIIYGLYKQEAGEIHINGQAIAIHSPKDSIGAGIGMVHQHFMLIPVFTVAENIMLGDEGTGINAGFWRRFYALFIDSLLLTTVFFLFEFLLNLLGVPLLRLVLLPILSGALAWLYFAGFESSSKQATLGKQAFGLIVTNEKGERLSFKVATLRFLAKILSGLPLAAGYIMAAFTAKKQALHDKLVHTLVVDNGGGILDRKTVVNRVRELSKQYGLDVDPTALVGQLPVGVQQRVEIIKTLYRHANILILDEPTAVLTPQEADDLFRIIRELTQQGVSVIFITHKLKEVLAIADRITVMRDGKVVGTTTPKETSEQKLATMMVGREVILKVDKDIAKPAEEILKIEGLRVRDMRGLETVRGIGFHVRAGEILGIAGVQGNGQTELVEALTGLRSVTSGKMWFSGKDMTGKPPRPITETGMAHIPEDRQRHGLVLPYPVADNMVLNTYYKHPYGVWGWMMPEAIDKNARKLVEDFDVRTPSPYVPVKKLSGGNQQKVIVARELSRGIKLLIANQPTRGLDVGSIEYIHKEIVAMRDRGIGVLLVSAELDEILALSDRIAVMYRGQIVTTVDAAKVTREQLGLWMAGAHPEE